MIFVISVGKLCPGRIIYSIAYLFKSLVCSKMSNTSGCRAGVEGFAFDEFIIKEIEELKIGYRLNSSNVGVTGVTFGRMTDSRNYPLFTVCSCRFYPTFNEFTSK